MNLHFLFNHCIKPPITSVILAPLANGVVTWIGNAHRLLVNSGYALIIS